MNDFMLKVGAFLRTYGAYVILFVVILGAAGVFLANQQTGVDPNGPNGPQPSELARDAGRG